MTINKSERLKIVIAGSVGSSRRTLQALLRHNAHIVGVLGLALEAAKNVSGYTRLDDLLPGRAIPYMDFVNINDADIVARVREWEPDLMFVVGLSQLVRAELLSIPRLGCVGFHPTWLPEGRGRAPVAWLTLDNRPGAATFFLMDEGMDSGPILVQQPFFVTSADYANDVVDKLEEAIDKALDNWLPQLLSGQWQPQPQDNALATYNGRRAPTDGLIDWHDSAKSIHALIRATSRPHPGAYTYVSANKLIIWRAELEQSLPHRGVVGRVLLVDSDKGCLIQTGDGLLWLTETEFVATESPSAMRVGMKMGYSVDDELYRLKQKMVTLEQRLSDLENKV